MKNTYVIIFFVAILLLFLSFATFHKAKSVKADRAVVTYLRKALTMGIFAVIMNTSALLTTSEAVADLCFGLLCVGVLWELMFLMEFTTRYTDGYTKNDYARAVAYILAVADMASLILNTFFHHAYLVPTRHTASGEAYFAISAKGPYFLHLIFSWLLVTAMLLILLVKMFRSPALYRKKYLIVLLALACGAGVDAAYLFFPDAINVAVISYAAVSVCICYCTLIYVPRGLKERTLSLVVQETENGVVCFDEGGRCVYVNEAMQRWFYIQRDVEQLEEEYHTWYREQAGRKEVWDEKREKDGAAVYYRISYQKLLDEKGRPMGGFFTIQNRTQEEEKLHWERHQATHDRLTDIYNQEHFYEKTAELLQADPQEEYVLICSDIKDFKLVNDLFGNETGDKVLCQVAERLRQSTPAGAVYGRLTSDRFAVCLPKCHFRLEDFISTPQNAIHVTENFLVYIYAGVYEIMDTSVPVAVMCDRCNLAIRTIKGDYQKMIAFYDDRLRQNILREQGILRELDNAMAAGQIIIFLQPQILEGGQVLGGEALVRWMHPEKGMIPPGEFIGVLEQTGLIAKVDAHVWELACQQLKRWREQGREDMYISVNISPRDFYYMDIYKTFRELVEKYGISPGQLKLEITESTVMQELDKNLNLIDKLRKHGFVVEMDDFGSGYSSLNMLKDINVDMLKLDLAFLGETKEEEKSRVILKTVVALARELDIPVLAEGVETREQVDYLTEIGCKMFQGYYFAKPMKVVEFEEKYMENREYGRNI